MTVPPLSSFRWLRSTCLCDAGFEGLRCLGTRYGAFDVEACSLGGEDDGWWVVEGGVHSARVLASAASQFWVDAFGDILTWLSDWGGRKFVSACVERM